MRIPLAGFAFCFFLCGCAHVLTEQEKADFSEKISETSFRSKKTLPGSHKSRIPLQAGQWVTIETTFKDSSGAITSMSLATYKVIGVRRDTIALEIENLSTGRAKPVTTAFVARHLPLASNEMGMTKEELDDVVDQLQIKRIVTRSGDGAPQELPVKLAPAARPFIEKFLISGYRVGEIKKEACSTDILQSSACLSYDFEIENTGKLLKGRIDAHSSVPIVGFIRQDGERYSSRVIAYGLSGAKSKLIKSF